MKNVMPQTCYWKPLILIVCALFGLGLVPLLLNMDIPGYMGVHTYMTYANHIRFKVPEIPTVTYIPPARANVSKIGKAMNVPLKLLENLSIPLNTFVPLTEELMTNLVFVTGASSNHFLESVDAVASVQTCMPAHRILYYDLGLKEQQLLQVKGMCNVTYRRFDKAKYPKHVSNLGKYSWKALLIHEVIAEYPSAMWFDASIRLMHNFSTIRSHLLTAGFQFCESSGIPTHIVTHPSMYDYLPTDVEQQKLLPQFGGNSIVITRSEDVYKNILYWAVLCSLDPNCINPRGAKKTCRFVKGNLTVHAGCHRYDQSIFNILASNFFGYRRAEYSHISVRAHRAPSSWFKLRVCHNNHSDTL